MARVQLLNMIIPPDKRKQYYERALAVYQPGAPRPDLAFSCNMLCRYMAADYAEINLSTATADKLVKEYLPEYYEVLKERKGSPDPKNGSIVISSWPPTIKGNIARCEALTEAINRVNLIITDKQTLF